MPPARAVVKPLGDTPDIPARPCTGTDGGVLTRPCQMPAPAGTWGVFKAATRREASAC